VTRQVSLYIGILLSLVFCMTPRTAKAQNALNTRDVDQVLQSVQKGCEESHGDPERQRYHFVFAFNTSHYGDDGIQGGMMRALVTDLAGKLLVPGDAYSIATWEKTLWGYRGPVALQGQNEADLVAQLAPLPTAPQHDSQGGHDTEQAIVDILDKVRQAAPDRESSTVVLMLVTDEHSLLPTDHRPTEKLLGSNAPQYQAALERFVRHPHVKVSYTIQPQDKKGETLTRSMDVVLLTPKQLTGEPIAGVTRSQWHQEHPAPASSPASVAAAAPPTQQPASAPVPESPPEVNRSGNRSVLPYILLGAALLALVIWLTVKARAGTKGLAPSRI
jgi:hypothetical protein